MIDDAARVLLRKARFLSVSVGLLLAAAITVGIDVIVEAARR